MHSYCFFVLFLPMCGSRKHPYPQPGGSMEIRSGEGGGGVKRSHFWKKSLT